MLKALPTSWARLQQMHDGTLELRNRWFADLYGSFSVKWLFGLLPVLCSEVCPGKASMFSRGRRGGLGVLVEADFGVGFLKTILTPFRSSERSPALPKAVPLPRRASMRRSSVAQIAVRFITTIPFFGILIVIQPPSEFGEFWKLPTPSPPNSWPSLLKI